MSNKQTIPYLFVCLIALLMLNSCGKKTTNFTPISEHATIENQGDQYKQAPLPSGNGGYVKTGNPYQIAGKWYYPLASSKGYNETGIASWYGEKFHGRTTANGERYDMHKISAAHNTLPMPSMVRVTNLDNHRSVIVRVNDRGPFVKNRIIDLSYAAAKALAYDQQGTAHVRVTSLDSEAMNKEISNKKKAHQEAPLIPKVTIPIATDSAAKKGAIYVQLGAFSSYDNAKRLHEDLTHNYPNIRIHHTTGTPWYRVRIGPYHKVSDSEAVILSLQQQGYPHAMLVIE
ncbi:MAG: septal ring lytic transglycosylase RlpA family protein [Mariprofundaceae bacterium]|nr:septal ring lytic transglycosylase RlpA family protein [Mariprofundaceae bacterium]